MQLRKEGMAMSLSKSKRLQVLTLLLAICVVVAMELWQRHAARAMTVEEARKLTAADKTASYAPPPRTIDDITKVLEQNRPDPKKIEQLRATADQPVPAGLSGMALADFYNKRGLAARDLGRTQQRLADLRDAWRLAKPIATQPTTAPGAGISGGDLSVMTSQERSRYYQRRGNLQSRSLAENRQNLNERVPPVQQHALRILQNYVGAEADAGNFRIALTVYEQVRPQIINALLGLVINLDFQAASWSIRNGDIAAAGQWIARAQHVSQERRQLTQWNLAMNVGNIESAQGALLLATGKLAEAEAKFRSAMRRMEQSLKANESLSEKAAPGTVEAVIEKARLQLAQVLAREGKLIEAEVEVRRSLVEIMRLQSDSAPQTASTVLILADILQTQGRYRDAQRLAEAALDIYVRGGVDPAVHADALQRIAVGQASLGRWDEAMATYEKLKAAVANDESARKRHADGNLDLAVALVRSGQATAAIPIFENIIKKRVAEGGNNDYAIAEVRGFLGTALAAAGRNEEAFRTLHAAVPILLHMSDSSANEEGAVDEANRRQLIIDGYFNLLTQVRSTELEKRLNINATDEAFRMADVAHAKSVHSAIAASSARAASGEAALVELIRQTQDTDQRVAAISDLLKATLNAPADQQDAKVIQSLRKDVEQLREARKTLRKEIERRFPQYAQLISPKPAGIAEARAKLHDGDALIVTYFSGGRGHVWAIPKHGEPAFAPMALSESDIVGLVDELARALNSNAILVSELPPFSVAAAHKLYTSVLEPVASGWQNAKNIIVIPDGVLGRLPFSLLVTHATTQPEEAGDKLRFAGYRKVPFLIRDATVTHSPSVAAFVTLRSVPAGSQHRKPFIGFGDPWFSLTQAAQAQSQQQATQVAMAGSPIEVRAAPKTQGMASVELAQLPRLPDTADEVREIARVLGANPVADVLLGVKANEKAVRSMRLDDRRVVMFATHGLVPGELDGLTQPALALSSPTIPGVEGDGLLTVEKILGLKLDADWVVLSACNTAAGEGGSAEAVSGLGRAFFYAGARALLVTHWPVETTSARALTTDLFRRQAAAASLSRASALREAMLDMITKGERADDNGRPLFAYAHPMFWAPFALVGEGANR
jgi:CHAT domain-containing protein